MIFMIVAKYRSLPKHLAPSIPLCTSCMYRFNQFISRFYLRSLDEIFVCKKRPACSLNHHEWLNEREWMHVCRSVSQSVSVTVVATFCKTFSRFLSFVCISAILTMPISFSHSILLYLFLLVSISSSSSPLTFPIRSFQLQPIQFSSSVSASLDF